MQKARGDPATDLGDSPKRGGMPDIFGGFNWSRIWVVEVIAPFGAGEAMVADLKIYPFPDKTAY